jgi:hypothetical protein
LISKSVIISARDNTQVDRMTVLRTFRGLDEPTFSTATFGG